MKKVLLTTTALLATAGAMAQGTTFDVPQNFTRLTADELNAVTGTKRIAIECTQVTNYNQFYNGTANRTTISGTTLPEDVVFEWIAVDGEETFNVKKPASGQYVATNNITTFVESGADNVAQFKASKPTNNIGDSHYSSDTDVAYQVRLTISPGFTTWFNFNGNTYTSGTGVWGVLHVLDLDDYRKVTMTIQKGEDDATTTTCYAKNGSEIEVPDYLSEGYVSEYNYRPAIVADNDQQTLQVTYVLDEQKAQLLTKIRQAKEYKGGTSVGEYSEASVATLASAVATAENKLSGTVTSEDVAALQSAIDGLTRNMPEPGRFYRLATWKTQNAGKVAYANNENKCYWGLNETPAAVWVFEDAGEGTYYLKNLATGSYVDNYTSTAGGANVLIEKDETKTVTVEHSGDGRKVGIRVGNDLFLDRDQNSPFGVCHWNGGIGDNRKWLIDEVEPAGIKHTLSVGGAGWATLVLGFNVNIPDTERVTVYAVESTSATSATLKPVTGVLPANTAVLVNAPAKSSVEFAYTAESASVRSLLKGTLYDKNIIPATGQTCYVLSMPADATEPGFYKAALNQESNTAFKNNANKVYLPVATDNGAPSLSFVFDTETGIEGVTAATAAGKTTVYDLSGRCVKSAQKGIYIINGKKVVK